VGIQRIVLPFERALTPTYMYRKSRRLYRMGSMFLVGRIVALSAFILTARVVQAELGIDLNQRSPG
jgi:hypothetical protein